MLHTTAAVAVWLGHAQDCPVAGVCRPDPARRRPPPQWLVVCAARSHALRQLDSPSSEGAEWWPSFRPLLLRLVPRTQVAVVLARPADWDAGGGQRPPRRASVVSVCARLAAAAASRGLGSAAPARPRPRGPARRPGASGAGGWGMALGPSHQRCRGGAPAPRPRPAGAAVRPRSAGPAVGDPGREAGLCFGRCFLVYLALSKCSRSVAGRKGGRAGALRPLRSAAAGRAGRPVPAAGTGPACAPAAGQPAWRRLSEHCPRRARTKRCDRSSEQLSRPVRTSAAKVQTRGVEATGSRVPGEAPSLSSACSDESPFSSQCPQAAVVAQGRGGVRGRGAPPPPGGDVFGGVPGRWAGRLPVYPTLRF